mgnify:CR=1 FL=1
MLASSWLVRLAKVCMVLYACSRKKGLSLDPMRRGTKLRNSCGARDRVRRVLCVGGWGRVGAGEEHSSSSGRLEIARAA